MPRYVLQFNDDGAYAAFDGDGWVQVPDVESAFVFDDVDAPAHDATAWARRIQQNGFETDAAVVVRLP
jgi:hypothetical protein